MNDRPLGITTSQITVEPEDAQLTGQTRNLERRLLGLNVIRHKTARVILTEWSVQVLKSFQEGSTTLDLSPAPGPKSVRPFAREHLAHHAGLKVHYDIHPESSPTRRFSPYL